MLPAGARARRAAPDDLPFIRLLDMQVCKEALNLAHLPEPVLTPLLEMQHQARSQGYAAAYPHAEDYIFTNPDGPFGRLLLDRAQGPGLRIVDIALLPPWRNRGIATAAILALQGIAAAHSAPLLLSVAAGNRAAQLYQRLGFRKTASDGAYTAMAWENPPAKNKPFQPVPPGTCSASYSMKEDIV